MQKSQPVFSSGQESKFKQLQLEIAALEEQLKNVLNEPIQLTDDRSLHSPIPLIYVDDRIAKTGIKLAHEKYRRQKDYSWRSH